MIARCRLYLRGKAYCLRALEVRWKGIGSRLLADPAGSLARAEKKDVEMLYWTAASWGAAVSLGLDQPELIVDFPVVRALAERALALDEGWSKGALHELMISLDSLPEAVGGDPHTRASAFRSRGRTAEGPGAWTVHRAGGRRFGARGESRRVRKAAQAGARHGPQRRSLRAARDAHHAATRTRAARPNRHPFRAIALEEFACLPGLS